jgi:hypothetical protein
VGCLPPPSSTDDIAEGATDLQRLSKKFVTFGERLASRGVAGIARVWSDRIRGINGRNVRDRT